MSLKVIRADVKEYLSSYRSEWMDLSHLPILVDVTLSGTVPERVKPKLSISQIKTFSIEPVKTPAEWQCSHVNKQGKSFGEFCREPKTTSGDFCRKHKD